MLVFAGAGTSVELGVPAMEGMAIEFLAHARQWQVEPELVHKLMGDVLDVELLIESLDQICSARHPLQALLDTHDQLARVDSVRSEVEWFVQHTAERIAAHDAHLMWGAVLRVAAHHELTIVTTNYDRAIELAANAQGVVLADGFALFGGEEVAAWIGFNSASSSPSIVKLHGSTDWYANKSSGDPQKLRHPMPLFGRGTLRLSNGSELGSALVLPSREKLLTRPPYPRLSQAFLNAGDSCDAAVFVGSSLRDPHIRDAAAAIATTRPVFLVNPQGDPLGLPHARPIAQPASEFLISTLPAALADSEPLTILEAASAIPRRNNADVLDALRLATDTKAHQERRCGAIETLDQQSVILDEVLIRDLLLDEDETVSRYALGLVATSPARTSLITIASGSPHSTRVSFSEELALLHQLIDDEMDKRNAR